MLNSYKSSQTNELYHGISTKFSDSILNGWIKKQNRKYVHVSSDIDTATKVGKRYGELVIFLVDSQLMHQEGYKFYLSENKVWLTDYIPTKYIRILS